MEFLDYPILLVDNLVKNSEYFYQTFDSKRGSIEFLNLLKQLINNYTKIYIVITEGTELTINSMELSTNKMDVEIIITLWNSTSKLVITKLEITGDNSNTLRISGMGRNITLRKNPLGNNENITWNLISGYGYSVS